MQKRIKVVFLKKQFLKIATAFDSQDVCCVVSCEMKSVLYRQKSRRTSTQPGKLAVCSLASPGVCASPSTAGKGLDQAGSVHHAFICEIINELMCLAGFII